MLKSRCELVLITQIFMNRNISAQRCKKERKKLK
jgi:hypothetical protein